jgi:hypothetical protein
VVLAKLVQDRIEALRLKNKAGECSEAAKMERARSLLREHRSLVEMDEGYVLGRRVKRTGSRGRTCF